MIGLNGGLLGSRRRSGGGVAIGSWSLNEQAVYQRKSSWIGTADTSFNNVSLLLHMDGSNGSTAIIDSSKYNATATCNGTSQLSTTQSKFGGSSAFFAGTNSWITLPYNSAFSPVANEDFTIEAWIYLTSTPGLQRGQIIGIHEFGSPSAGDWALLVDSSRYFYIWVQSTNSTWYNSTVLALNTWHHVAVSRSGTGANNFKVFVNGGLNSSTYSVNNTLVGNASYSLSLGADQNGDESLFPGYIDEVRITKGVARYTAAFTPPTAPFGTWITPADPNFFSSVSLLLHMDGSNGSTTFTDNSSNAFVVTRQGNPVISTADSVFGGSSGSFDGGSYLTVASNTALNFGTGDFTLEMWFKPLELTDPYYGFYEKYLFRAMGGGSSTGLYFGMSTNNGFMFGFTTSIQHVTNVFPTLNAWQHIAVTRSSSSLRIFKDGVQAGSTFTNTSSYDLGLGGMSINGDPSFSRSYLKGYCDEVRITKGIARYTANFTVPSSPFPNG